MSDGNKVIKLSFGLLAIICLAFLIRSLTHKASCNKDTYTYRTEYTGTSPNYNSSPRSYKSFVADDTGDTAYPFGERCKGYCPHNARDRGVALCNQGKIL